MTPQEAQAIREALNLTPIKLAAYMGVDDRSVKRWEAGEYTRHPAGVPGPVQIALEWINDPQAAHERLERYLREAANG